MKSTHLLPFTVTVVVTALSVRLSTCMGQGSLTPPGPPGATMLTLSQVEPRTPVDAVHTPGTSYTEFLITNSGSYYLTTNIVDSGGTLDGIIIQTNNVTLDLNGFSLLGTPGTVFGIYVGGCTNVFVHDGLVSGWGNFGIYAGGGDITLDRLTASGNSGGIFFSAPGGSVIRNSIINGNAGIGIYLAAKNITCEQVTVSGNNPGFYFSGVASGVVKDCTVNENVTAGVECVFSTNMTLEDLTVSDNTGYGLELNGFQNGVVSDCQVNGNANNTGIYLNGSGCFIIGNNCTGNGNSIFVQGANNQIDGNHVIGSNPATNGILIANAPGVTNNIVIRNFVTGYGTNDFSFGPGQIAGPMITNAVSGIVNNSNPWANFGF